MSTIKSAIIVVFLFAYSWMVPAHALTIPIPNPDGVGQLVKLETHLDSYVGKVTWLIVIRDVDHNQNIPYLFDIEDLDNIWVALTYGKHYLILASRLQIETYSARCNKYKQYRINNFCHLESNDRIIRGKSMRVMLVGKLTPNPATYICRVHRYPDMLTIVVPAKAATITTTEVTTATNAAAASPPAIVTTPAVTTPIVPETVRVAPAPTPPPTVVAAPPATAP